MRAGNESEPRFFLRSIIFYGSNEIKGALDVRRDCQLLLVHVERGEKGKISRGAKILREFLWTSSCVVVAILTVVTMHASLNVEEEGGKFHF